MADSMPVYTPPPKQSARGVTTPRTRMAARLVPIPKVYDAEGDKTKKVVKKVLEKRPIQLRVKAPIDDQFDAKVWFSEAFGEGAGTTWSEPLEIEDRDLAAGKDFYWKCEITQHRVDPLLQGFRTRWELLTSGWSFVDSYGDTLYDEAISNPVTITRVIKAPGAITVRPRFRVVVEVKYLP